VVRAVVADFVGCIIIQRNSGDPMALNLVSDAVVELKESIQYVSVAVLLNTDPR
jgi:hypothetical protein